MACATQTHDRFKFETPFNAIVAGPTGCGKTYFVCNLLKEQKLLVDNPFKQVFYCYGIYQPIYDNIKAAVPHVTFVRGLPEIEKLLDDNGGNRNTKINSLCILDDLMLENEKQLARYFIRLRHAGLSIIFLTQCFFFSSRYMRLISRNAHYLVMFRNPRDHGSIRCLSQQIFAGRHGFLEEAYNTCTKSPYSYIIIDLKPSTRENRMIASRIFHGEKTQYYVCGNDNMLSDSKSNKALVPIEKLSAVLPERLQKRLALLANTINDFSVRADWTIMIGKARFNIIDLLENYRGCAETCSELIPFRNKLKNKQYTSRE